MIKEVFLKKAGEIESGRNRPVLRRFPSFPWERIEQESSPGPR